MKAPRDRERERERVRERESFLRCNVIRFARGPRSSSGVVVAKIFTLKKNRTRSLIS